MAGQCRYLPGALLRHAFALLCVLLCVLLAGCNPSAPAATDTAIPAEPTLFELGGSTMGTHYRVVYSIAGADSVSAIPEPQRPGALHAVVQQRLDMINNLMSTWDPESQLSLFNRSSHTDWVALAPATLALITVASKISDQTEGAYDITMAPLLELYGFGASAHGRQTPPVPSATAIEAALQQVGWRHLDISDDGLRVRKSQPDLQIDLSSIAKGYAVDELGRLLEARGVNHYLVDIGGELRSRVATAQHRPWRIGLDVPRRDRLAAAQGKASGDQAQTTHTNDTAETSAGLLVRDAYVATSGDYRNYRQQDGRRISHLIDARDGKPVAHGLTAVTVLHETTALADAWATAFMVLGVKASMLLAESEAIAVLLIEHVDRGDAGASFKVHRSTAMQRLQPQL